MQLDKKGNNEKFKKAHIRKLYNKKDGTDISEVNINSRERRLKPY